MMIGQSTPNNSDNNNSSISVPNESTPVINYHAKLKQSEVAGEKTGPQDSDNDLWHEMEAPWPATFERAISLLSSPVIKADRAKDLTRSPKPGNTPIAIRNRMLVSSAFNLCTMIGRLSSYTQKIGLFFLYARRNDREVQIILNSVVWFHHHHNALVKGILIIQASS